MCIIIFGSSLSLHRHCEYVSLTGQQYWHLSMQMASPAGSAMLHGALCFLMSSHNNFLLRCSLIASHTILFMLSAYTFGQSQIMVARVMKLIAVRISDVRACILVWLIQATCRVDEMTSLLESTGPGHWNKSV